MTDAAAAAPSGDITRAAASGEAGGGGDTHVTRAAAAAGEGLGGFVGRRLEMWWAEEQRWFSGLATRFLPTYSCLPPPSSSSPSVASGGGGGSHSKSGHPAAGGYVVEWDDKEVSLFSLTPPPLDVQGVILWMSHVLCC